MANVALNNLGDPVSSWTVTWSFANGQQVSSAWNAAVSQSGSAVTARNMSYNASLGTGAATSFGFVGSVSGSTNAVPGSFTMNGTACTGGGGGGGVTTTTRTTTTTRPVTTTTRTTTTTRPVTTTTRTGTYAWTSSDQWGNWTNGGYTLYNNMWGANGQGTQTIWANSYSNWGVIATFPETSGVKSYPNASWPANRAISSLGRVSSSFNVTVPGTGSYATAYDIWTDNNAYEIMLWMNKNGAVGPIAASYDANGAVPSVTNLSVGGHTWNVYRGSNGSNQVYSFIRTNTNSGTVDILAILNWLRTNSWLNSGSVLGNVQFGFEITSAPGGQRFTVNSYSTTVS